MAIVEISPRVDMATLNRYIRKRVEPLYRDEPLLAMFRSRGKITKGHGKTVRWRPRFRRRTINPNAGDIISISFPQTATKRQAELPWRSYDLGESVTLFEQYVTEGPAETVLYRLVEETTKEVLDDFMVDFKEELYVDGNAGAANRLHGLESIFSVSGAYSGGYVGAPNDSYAGMLTTLGNYGGAWSATTWPRGTGPTEYCAWTPLVVDYTDALWTGDTDTWPNTWHQAMRFMTTYMRILQKKGPDLFLLDPELLLQAKHSLKSSETFEITQNVPGKVVNLGFSTLNFEGVELMDAYAIAGADVDNDAVGYAINFDHIGLQHLGPQLVNAFNDTDIEAGQQHRLALMSFVQMFVDTPAYFGKFKPIT